MPLQSNDLRVAGSTVDVGNVLISIPIIVRIDINESIKKIAERKAKFFISFIKNVGLRIAVTTSMAFHLVP